MTDTPMIQPRATVTRSSTPKKAYANIGEPQFEITAWCPDENAQLPPEQVHFIVHWPADLADLPPLVIRFKSPDSLGFFVEELARFRRQVWPRSTVANVEAVPQLMKQHESDTRNISSLCMQNLDLARLVNRLANIILDGSHSDNDRAQAQAAIEKVSKII